MRNDAHDYIINLIQLNNFLFFSNPEAVVSVCREQGLSESQCKMFSQGFQVIDRFFNVVEKPKDGMIIEDSPSGAGERGGAGSATESPSSSSAAASIATNRLHAMDDDPSVIQISRMARPIGRAASTTYSQSMMGSRTWSTHVNPVLGSEDSLISISRPIVPVPQNRGAGGGSGGGHRYTTEKKITPINGGGAEGHFSTTPIHVPTSQISTSPIVPVIERPLAKVPPPPPPFASRPSTNSVITRPRRYVTVNPFERREKRDADYYEQMSRIATPTPMFTQTPSLNFINPMFPTASNIDGSGGASAGAGGGAGASGGAGAGGGAGGGGDYYDNVDSSESSSNNNKKSGVYPSQPRRGGGSGGSNFTPLNCLNLLG